MSFSRISVAVYVVLVFLSGVMVGGFGYRLYTTRDVQASTAEQHKSHAELRKKYVEEMRTRLNLSDDQIAKLQSIMEATGKEFDEYHQWSDAKVKQIREEYANRVRGILNDQQRAEYEKLREERRQRRLAHEKSRRGH